MHEDVIMASTVTRFAPNDDGSVKTVGRTAAASYRAGQALPTSAVGATASSFMARTTLPVRRASQSIGRSEMSPADWIGRAASPPPVESAASSGTPPRHTRPGLLFTHN